MSTTVSCWCARWPAMTGPQDVLGGVDLVGERLRRHQGAALRVAAVIAGSTDEAADIVQDAFVKAHGRLGTFRGDGSVRS